MNNMLCLVGRLVSEPITITSDEGKDYTTITLAIPRSFKNEEGCYDTDFVKVKLYGCIATNTIEYCRKGDLIGVKGRLESNNDRLEVIAEKITFLATTNNAN